MLHKLFVCFLLVGTLAACNPPPLPAVDAYMALVPVRMYAGERQAASFTLWSGDEPASSWVEVSLWDEGSRIESEKAFISGKGRVELKAPSKSGEYRLTVTGRGFTDETTVEVAEGLLIFLERDKPIYKPSQTIHARIVTLDSELLPKPATVTVEVLDAKGIKVTREVLETDEYGMGDLSLPLSAEPNLGTWKVTATAGEQKAQVDVRVEKYVLPKYEVKIDLEKDWFLPEESIEGTVTAEYSFGKKVTGELEVTASRYVGEWEEFAHWKSDVDGEVPFEIPPVGYVAGVPAARGMGNVQLEVTVREKNTGYEEKATRLLTIAPGDLCLQLIPEGGSFKPGLPFGFLLVTETPDNEPVDAEVDVSIAYLNEKFEELSKETKKVETSKGKAIFKVAPPTDAIAVEVLAQAGDAHTTRSVRAGYSPSGNFIHVEQVGPGPLNIGDRAEFKVHSTHEAVSFYYEVVSRGRVVFTDYTHSDKISSYNMLVWGRQSAAHLTNQRIPGILGAGPGRVALFLLVAPFGVTSTKACAPRPDGHFSPASCS